MPLVAVTQPIVDQEALNGQLEDVGANDDNKDQDSDNNNKDDNNNAVNCPDHGTEGKKTTKQRKQGLFWSFRLELQHAIIQSVIEDAPEQQKSIKEQLVAQCKAKKEKEQLIRELNLRKATKAYIDAMGGPGDVPGERALGSATDQNCWNLTVLTSSDNPPLLHDINRAPLDWKTLFTDGTSRRQTPFIAPQETLNGVPATNEICESAIGEATYQLSEWLDSSSPD